MSVILGIDAAWTRRNKSGVALAVKSGSDWQLVKVAPSYELFLGTPEPSGDVLAAKLLERSKELAGEDVSLVTVDMPMSLDPITCRRESDNAVSRTYGSRHASTHTPSEVRPGRVSTELRDGFCRCGYRLKTKGYDGFLAEVYPHPALIEYMNISRRSPYKYAKRRKYWPYEAPSVRLRKLREEWARILQCLDQRLPGAVSHLRSLPEGSSGIDM